MIYGAGASRPRGILSPRKKSQEITTGARRPRPIASNAKKKVAPVVRCHPFLWVVVSD